MSITGYLAGARQRLFEFGAFVEREPDSLPPRLQMWADWMAEREEPGLTTWVAFAVNPEENRPEGLLDDLVTMSRNLSAVARTDVLAVLVIVVDRPLTREQYDRWQAAKFHVGPVRVVPWVVDLTRNHLFQHEGLPRGIDPDLAMLVAPEPPIQIEEPAVEERPRRLRIPEAWVTVALLAIVTGIWLAMTIAGGSLDATKDDMNLLAAWGAMTRPEMWTEGAYWRLFTAAWVHIGIEHLFMNGMSLWFVGRVVEALFGHGRMLVIYLVSAVAGSVASAMLGPALVIGAGASGAIFGLVGAIVWYRISSPLRTRIAWRPLLVTLAANLGLGLALYKYVDNWNHLGGLAGGLLAAAAVGVPTVPQLPKPRFRLTGLVHVALAIVLVAASAWVVAGKVDLPGPGRQLARTSELVDAGRFVEAEPGLRAAVADQPNEPYLRYLLAFALYQQGKCREAQGEMNYVLSQDPDVPEYRELQAAIKACLH